MEYKIRYIQKKKAQKVKNREEAGFKRIKVRGRKRWVKQVKAAETAEAKKD